MLLQLEIEPRVVLAHLLTVEDLVDSALVDVGKLRNDLLPLPEVQEGETR